MFAWNPKIYLSELLISDESVIPVKIQPQLFLNCLEKDSGLSARTWFLTGRKKRENKIRLSNNSTVVFAVYRSIKIIPLSRASKRHKAIFL
jgi:hypothetical protein